MRRELLWKICFTVLISITSCDSKEKKDEIRAEAEKEIVTENEAEAALKEQITIEDNREFGLIAEIKQLENLNSLEYQIKRLGMDSVFSQQGLYTVFAPANEAFKTLDTSPTAKQDTTMSAFNQDVLLNHIVENKWNSARLTDTLERSNGQVKIKTKSGDSLQALLVKDEIILRDAMGTDAKIISSDIEASNGIIHIIDKIVRPQ